MRLEDEVILYLSCTTLDRPLPPRLKDILSAGLDWEYLLGRAVHHRVVTQVHENLRLLATRLGGQVPQRIVEEMRAVSHSFLGYSMTLNEEAKTILNVLKDEGVEFTPIKGLVLSETVYPERYLRFYRDIDLFFPSLDEMRRAEKKMTGLGYDFVLSDARGSMFSKPRQELSMVCDLHYSASFFNKFQYPTKIEELWTRSSVALICGVEVTVMSPEHMLLILSLHSFYHGSFSLIDFADAVHIIEETENLDWQFIQSLLKQYPCAFGIPMTIIYSTYLDLFDREIIPNATFKVLTELNPATARITQEPREHSLRNTQIPLPYRRLCLLCNHHPYCPLSLYIDVSYTKYSREKLQPLDQRLFRYLLEYYFILTTVREKHGIKYAIRCLYEETAVFGDYIIDRLARMLGRGTQTPRLNPNIRLRSQPQDTDQ
jgi:hypothetical protein